jgi:hypothetical protein
VAHASPGGSELTTRRCIGTYLQGTRSRIRAVHQRLPAPREPLTYNLQSITGHDLQFKIRAHITHHKEEDCGVTRARGQRSLSPDVAYPCSCWTGRSGCATKRTPAIRTSRHRSPAAAMNVVLSEEVVDVDGRYDGPGAPPVCTLLRERSWFTTLEVLLGRYSAVALARQLPSGVPPWRR